MNNAVLEAAVVDSSAVMSIFDDRLSASAFRQALRRTTRLYMSAGTLMELSVIFIGKKSSAGTQPLDDLLQELQIQIVPLDLEMIKQGRQGCANYGKGHSPASLNMGDLFSYAIAKQMNLPLYFEGLVFLKQIFKMPCCCWDIPSTKSIHPILLLTSDHFFLGPSQ